MSLPHSPPPKSKRPYSQGDTHDPATKRARTAGAFIGSSSLSPTEGIPSRRLEGYEIDTDGSSNLTATKPESSDEGSPNSLGPFFGKLPRETRNTIYEYLLDHLKSPLARTTDEVIQPSFVRWSFRRERFVSREIDPVPPHIIDTNILAVNKAIYNEALEAMYRGNTISLSLQQCRYILGTSDIIRQGVIPSNTATAKHVLLRMGHSLDKRLLQNPNSIDLDVFFTNIQAALPRLRSVTIRTDHALHATSALFNIGQDLMNSEQVGNGNVEFGAVGSLVAETNLGFIVELEHRRITRELQQQLTKSLLDSKAWYRTKAAQRCWTKRLLEAVELGEVGDDHRPLSVSPFERRIVSEEWNSFSKDVPDAFKACAFESHEFWTYAVGRYQAFTNIPPSNGSEAGDGSEEADGSDADDDADAGEDSDVDNDSEEDSDFDDSDSSDVATSDIRLRSKEKAPRRHPSILDRYNSS
jgi:hypothetical protein